MAKQSKRQHPDANHGHTYTAPNRPIKVPFADYRFVRIELTEKEKDEFRGQLASGEFDDFDPSDWCRSGYKLTFSFDDTNNTFIATLTAQYKNMPNSGLVLTGRGGSIPTALAVLQFKHIHLCGDDGWKAAESLRGGSYSDIG